MLSCYTDYSAEQMACLLSGLSSVWNAAGVSAQSASHIFVCVPARRSSDWAPAFAQRVSLFLLLIGLPLHSRQNEPMLWEADSAEAAGELREQKRGFWSEMRTWTNMEFLCSPQESGFHVILHKTQLLKDTVLPTTGCQLEGNTRECVKYRCCRSGPAQWKPFWFW